jgi:hypothetical protein
MPLDAPGKHDAGPAVHTHQVDLDVVRSGPPAADRRYLRKAKARQHPQQGFPDDGLDGRTAP